MLNVAVDPSTSDPRDSLIPGSQEVSLDEFDEGISLDDGAGAADHDPLFDESGDGVADVLVEDMDFDGRADEEHIDLDGDGVTDSAIVDTDGDGYEQSYEDSGDAAGLETSHKNYA